MMGKTEGFSRSAVTCVFGGRVVCAVASFALTNCSVVCILVPQLKLTSSSSSPGWVREWMRVTPGTPATAFSSGRVMFARTLGMGVSPAEAVMMMRGAVRSGKMATGRVCAQYSPAAQRTIDEQQRRLAVSSRRNG